MDPLRIAVLGWGSLIWDPRQLSIQDGWHENGPVLPIEFSRISGGGRLTLVIDNINGTKVRTRYALSANTKLKDAIENLLKRERTDEDSIGSLEVRGDQEKDEIRESIRAWAERKDIEAVVWTALESNFKEETGKKFSVPEAIKYLENRSDGEARRAWEYIARAPPEVQTELRKALTEPR